VIVGKGVIKKQPTEYYRGRIEIEGVYLPLSRSVHHNFASDAW
jgi:hypothetical protein